MRYYLFLITIFFSRLTFAATVDTAIIYSQSMHKSIKCVVIKPDAYKKGQPLPTVYLLHGFSGSYNDWIIKAPQIKKYADQYSVLIVCPDGAYSSWYLNSPVDATMQYETYVALEVPAYIEAHYRTIKDRKARAITGLSMGGHGGLYLGFKHADFFGACGSMSGAVDLNAVRTIDFDISKRIGDTINHTENWTTYSVSHIVENYPKDSLHIIIDCGVEDFLIQPNRDLHQKLLQLKIPHDYIERPGAHTWPYWSNAIQYQLLFFRNYFDSNKIIPLVQK